MSSEKTTTMIIEGSNPTFESIFFNDGEPIKLIVPDYQRAFSWEQDQIALFLGDLVKYRKTGGYYFGHFITENQTSPWKIVDGQQRISTFVLFLIVCQQLASSEDKQNRAFTLIESFETVSYDRLALSEIREQLANFLNTSQKIDLKKPPTDAELQAGLKLSQPLTRSQRRIVLALVQFHQSFTKELKVDGINEYIKLIMDAHCSHHPTFDKSVAVHIFEMHNTRGVALSTIDAIKAKLMKFVYDHGDDSSDSVVEEIQDEFGEFYRMEEAMVRSSFRGELTSLQLLRLHLRVIDDGTKNTASQFTKPSANDSAENLIIYVEKRLHFSDDAGEIARDPAEGISYARKLAKELRKSMFMISEHFPQWDSENSLVGDALIQERDLSFQWFLLMCRALEDSKGAANGRLSYESLSLWEKFLFTRDLHEEYHRLRYKDDFPSLFEKCLNPTLDTNTTLRKYLKDGFRTDKTPNLQGIVQSYLEKHNHSVLYNAYYFQKRKMTYAIYKFETSHGANLRSIVKGTISVEHVLPQEWQWKWINGVNSSEDLTDEEKKEHPERISKFINGIGNLLILTPNENTSKGNNHPSYKKYSTRGGSYEVHNQNPEAWRDSDEWGELIAERGQKIYDFMVGNLIHTEPSLEI